MLSIRALKRTATASTLFNEFCPKEIINNARQTKRKDVATIFIYGLYFEDIRRPFLKVVIRDENSNTF